MVKAVRYLPKSEPAVHRCLQSFTATKMQAYSLKKKTKLRQRCIPVSVPNISEHFFAKHIWVVTAPAKYHSLSLLRRPHQQNVTLELGSLNISRANTVSCLLTAVSGSPRQLAELLLIKQAIRPKCS